MSDSPHSMAGRVHANRASRLGWLGPGLDCQTAQVSGVASMASLQRQLDPALKVATAQQLDLDGGDACACAVFHCVSASTERTVVPELSHDRTGNPS